MVTTDRQHPRLARDWRRTLLREKLELERLARDARDRNVRSVSREHRRIRQVFLSMLYGALLVGLVLSLRRRRAYMPRA